MPFTSDWKPVETNFQCHNCGVVGKIESRDWESWDEAHEDTEYRCLSCMKSWWVEGPDA